VVTPVVTTEGNESRAKLAWAIAHPARVRRLPLLIAKSACGCGELVERMPLSQSTVAQHLKILVARSGLNNGTMRG
jgi:ArsR family transcriptional regulator, arsenate/arsenite/antimonite-responsive transcriptional repressor